MTALDQLGILRAALAVPVWSRTAPQHVLLQEITREAEQDVLERVERFRGRPAPHPARWPGGGDGGFRPQRWPGLRWNPSAARTRPTCRMVCCSFFSA